jgi:hypothetical protein
VDARRRGGNSFRVSISPRVAIRQDLPHSGSPRGLVVDGVMAARANLAHLLRSH